MAPVNDNDQEILDMTIAMDIRRSLYGLFQEHHKHEVAGQDALRKIKATTCETLGLNKQ